MQQPIHPESPSDHPLTTSSGEEEAEAQRQLLRSVPRLAAAVIFSWGEAAVGPAALPILLAHRYQAALGGAAAVAAHQRQQGESRQPQPLPC